MMRNLFNCYNIKVNDSKINNFGIIADWWQLKKNEQIIKISCEFDNIEN